MRSVSEPDLRWSLANERTALAWVRTALALLAGGVGLSSLARVADLPSAVDLLGAAICLLGSVVAIGAIRTYRARDAAMRGDQPLPPSHMLTMLVSCLVVLSGLVAIYLVVSAF